jgi:hypothetical protein
MTSLLSDHVDQRSWRDSWTTQVAFTEKSSSPWRRRNGATSSLDIDIYRRPDGFLGHGAFRNPTYTNVCLNPRLHYHPSSMQAVLTSWVHRPRVLCDGKSLHDELDHLHSQRKMQCAHNPPAMTPQLIEKPTSADHLQDDTQTPAECWPSTALLL